MLEPGRQFATGTQYRYGFNGQERDDDISGNGNSYTAEYWEYDPRIGRRWNIEPLTAKYPNLSGYVALTDNPGNVTDPDGKDVIFVNGYRMFKTGSASDRDPAFQQKLKSTYWNDKYKGFTKQVETYFNDYSEHYVTGDHHYGSKAVDRIAEGKEVGIKMVSSGEIKVSKTNNVMTIVMHSQGNAEGVGVAEGIIEQAKKQGVDVVVNLVFLSVHQPYDIKMTDELKKRGIQFTYANDNNVMVQPMAKQPGGEAGLKGVLDANPQNIKNVDAQGKEDDGVDAHGATHNKPEAFEAIKKADQKNKIYKIKS